MTTPAPLMPDVPTLTKHYQDLVGRKVTGTLTTQKVKTGPTDKWFGAWYALEEGQVVGVIAVDLPLAAYFATAFGMIPVGQANTFIKTGVLDTTATENLYECLNVSTRFYHRALERPVVILGVAPHPTRAGVPVLPPEAKAILAQPRKRLDFNLTVDGYGAGQLAVLLG